MRKGKKAADGSGSIRQRKDGRWEGRYTYTDPRTGKICRSSIYGKTKREVAEKLRATTAEVDRGNYIHDSSMPLEQWVETYFTDYLIPQSAKGEKSNGTEKSTGVFLTITFSPFWEGSASRILHRWTFSASWSTPRTRPTPKSR